MKRVCTSRRYLAGLLRRRPLLDSTVTVPGGPGPHPVDAEFRAILEMSDVPLADGDDARPANG